MSTTRKLEVFAAGRKIGTLAETSPRAIYFEYGPEWLLEGFSISPFLLPLAPGLKREETLIFDGLFGVFDDSLPDGWGLLLMDRFFRAKGITPEALSPLDRLAYIGNRGPGILEHRPPNPEAAGTAAEMDLTEIAAQAERIAAGSTEEALPALRDAGGSSGGSRPKVFVAHHPSSGRMTPDQAQSEPGFEHWLVKFRAKEDAEDAGAIEAAYADMAKAAGVVMPPTRLFETKIGRFFGIQRFDRGPGGAKVHVHTFGGMIHSHFRHPNRDYQEFLSVVREVTRESAQVEQAFRRAVFNVLAHNRDDHVKNHAFVADLSGNWKLSPAYDLTHSFGVAGQHNMTVAGNGKPGVPDLLALAKDAGIGRRKASSLIDSASAVIRRWPDFAAKTGVSVASQAAVASSLLQA